MDRRDVPFEAGPGWEGHIDDVDTQYAIGVTADETTDGVPDIEDDSFLDAPSTVYPDLAHDLIEYTGQADTPGLAEALAEHMEKGVMAAISQPLSDNAIEEGGDPARAFLDRTEAGLKNGTLRPHLEKMIAGKRAEEIAKMGPLARRRALKADAEAARERYEARQEELRQIRRQTVERCQIDIKDLHAEDEVCLELGTHPSYEDATSTLFAKADGLEVVEQPDGTTRVGVGITIKNEDRTNPEAFVFDELPPGTRVVITDTAYARNDHVRYPRQIAAGESPVMYCGGQRLRIQTWYENNSDRTENMHIRQLTINGIKMFPEQVDQDRK